MPRQTRIEYEGATYHVMCRGDRREAIFEDDPDRELFLATLAGTAGKSGWLVHAYVLMGNHYHLLIETPAANLVRGMTWLQTTYTVRYHARHRTTGHLFGGRYKAILVDPEEPRYFATLLDYIHLNPARAGLARVGGPELMEYAWSSLPGYAKRRQRAKWLTVSRGLDCLGYDDTARGRRALMAELERRMREEAAERLGLADVEEQSLQSTLRRGWYFGREVFRDWLLEKAGAVLQRHRKAAQNYHGPEIAEHGMAEARQMIAESLKEAGLTPQSLSKLPKSDPRKVRIAAKVRARTTVPLKWLAGQLHMGSPMNVSRKTSIGVSKNA